MAEIEPVDKSTLDEEQAGETLAPFLRSAAGQAMRTVCVVTGASRGFGRAVAVAAVQQYTCSTAENGGKTSLLLVLVGRTEEGLRETAVLCEAEGPVEVSVLAADLGSMDILDLTVDRLLDAALSSKTVDTSAAAPAPAPAPASAPVQSRLANSRPAEREVHSGLQRWAMWRCSDSMRGRRRKSLLRH
mmetsp:Transcript_36943/g.92622  ORF Transcript_36943/g.92622 Transcript_36943/m.92622 type:complete len:188 (+) Transcript_36943:90-653(+)